ncbi:MAG: type IV pilus assembly protein PilW [Cellvibrionaceae bacterium]|jgi:type IV pilus assembly protein PilW
MSKTTLSLSPLQAGIGLIELMISMLIGLFVMAGVVQMFSTTSQNAVAVAGSSRIQENIRYIFSRLKEDIAQSGNLGCISASLNAQYNLNGEPPITNMLRTTGTDAYAFLSMVHGDNDVSNIDDVTDGTDIIRIRYVNHAVRYDVTAVTANNVTITGYDDTTLQPGQIVSVSNCSEGAIFMISNTPSDDGLIAHALGDIGGVENITTEKNISSGVKYNDGTGSVDVKSPFYLYAGSTGSYEYSIGNAVGAAGTCATTVGATSGPRHCALYRSDSGTREELAKGVHNLQVRYGWTDAAGNLRFSNSPSAAQLPLIDRMQVTVDFNSIDDAVISGNNVSGLIQKTGVTKTFNLFNQL